MSTRTPFSRWWKWSGYGNSGLIMPKRREIGQEAWNACKEEARKALIEAAQLQGSLMGQKRMKGDPITYAIDAIDRL